MMPRTIFIILALFLALGMAKALSDRKPPLPRDDDSTGSPMAGRKVFVAKGCHECHAVWGSGGTLGPDLAAVSRGRTFPQIAGLLWSHTPRMLELMAMRDVPTPTMTADEMADLVSYLYYLSYFDEPGDAAEGKKTFIAKGCSVCHDVGHVENPQLSSLNRFATCYSPSVLAQSMWNAAQAMSDAMEGREISQPLLEGRDLANILAWLNREGVPTTNRAPTLIRPGDPGTGAQVFEARKCSQCHRVGSTGGGTGPDLTRSAAPFTVAQVAGSMWNHAFKMLAAMEEAAVPQTPFEGTELADLIAYLFFAPYRDFPGDEKAGQKLFEAKGCNQCHEEGGIKWDASLLEKLVGNDETRHVEILAAFWNHAPQMERTMRSQEMDWPRFKEDEMRDLLTYLSSTLPAAPRKKSR